MYEYKTDNLIDRRELLKIKIKSLMEEAKIIRKAEKMTHGVLRNEMREHRIDVVRRVARNTHIAYALIRGRTMEQIESQGSYVPPDWAAIDKMIRRYGPAGATVEKLVDRVKYQLKKAA